MDPLFAFFVFPRKVFIDFFFTVDFFPDSPSSNPATSSDPSNFKNLQRLSGFDELWNFHRGGQGGQGGGQGGGKGGEGRGKCGDIVTVTWGGCVKVWQADWDEMTEELEDWKKRMMGGIQEKKVRKIFLETFAGIFLIFFPKDVARGIFVEFPDGTQRRLNTMLSPFLPENNQSGNGQGGEGEGQGEGEGGEGGGEGVGQGEGRGQGQGSGSGSGTGRGGQGGGGGGGGGGGSPRVYSMWNGERTTIPNTAQQAIVQQKLTEEQMQVQKQMSQVRDFCRDSLIFF